MECESQKGRGLLDLSQPRLSLGFVDSTVPTHGVLQVSYKFLRTANILKFFIPCFVWVSSGVFGSYLCLFLAGLLCSLHGEGRGARM